MGAPLRTNIENARLKLHDAQNAKTVKDTHDAITDCITEILLALDSLESGIIVSTNASQVLLK